MRATLMEKETSLPTSIATSSALAKWTHSLPHEFKELDSESTLQHAFQSSDSINNNKKHDKASLSNVKASCNNCTNIFSNNNINNVAAVDRDDDRWSELMQSNVYNGVALRHGVERIDLEDGYYIGTVDTQGRLTGYGRMTWNSGDCYAGEWECDAMHGTGQYTWADGDYYKGEYDHGEMSGSGEMHDRTGLYIGEWAHDARHGHGTMQYANGNVYTGDWVDGRCHGHGKLFEIDCGTTYEGMFAINEKHGMGVEINADGDVYDGEFAHGQPHGKGTYVWHDGTRYVGQVANGLPHGEGCEWLPNGDWIAGNFVNGEHDHVQPLHKAALVNINSSDHSNSDNETYNNTTPVAKSEETMPTKISSDAVKIKPDDDDDDDVKHSTRKHAKSTLQQESALLTNTHCSAHSNPLREEEEKENTHQNFKFYSESSTLPQYLFTEHDLSEWKSLRVVGRGSFGAVHEARLANGAVVCCKVIELGNIDSAEQMTKVRNEMSVMRDLSHPNIVRYYGSVEDSHAHTLNIFMEFCRAGSLAKELRQRRSESNNNSSSSNTTTASSSNSCSSKLFTNINELREWSRQVIGGIEYLHRHGVIHRDIKCDNILIGNNHELKLADFGCSKAIHDACSATHGCNTMVGTPYWMAPEVITCEQSEGAYGMKSDIWSFGCTIVEMITGKPPWPECNSLWAAVYKIANSTGLPTEIPDDLDEVLRDLLYRCFERNPRNRPTAK